MSVLCFVGEGGGVSLVISYRRALHQFGMVDYESLLSKLSNFFLCRGELDAWIWKLSPSSIF